MKKFKQLVMAFLVGVVSFGFTACSDENNEEKFELPEVGQASDNELDPHIDSWPLDHEELVDRRRHDISKGHRRARIPSGCSSRRAQHHRTSRIHMDG